MKHAAFFLFAIVHTAGAQQADSILLRYFRNSGGLEALLSVRSVRIERSVWQDMSLADPAAGIFRTGATEFSIEKTLLRKPCYERIERFESGKLAVESRQDAYLYSSKSHVNADTPVVYREPRRNRRVTLLLAANLAEMYQHDTLAYAGKEMLNGKEYETITGPYEHGGSERMKYFFSAATGLIDAYQRIRGGPAVTVGLGDYRTVAGFAVPFSKQSRNGYGVLFYKETIRVVEINPKIPNNAFRGF